MTEKEEQEENKIKNPARRGFLQKLGFLIGAGATATVANTVLSQPVSEIPQEQNYLKRTWKDGYLTFHEYEFPQNVQALFKTADRKRAIYCPIRKVTKVPDGHVSLDKNLPLSHRISNGARYQKPKGVLVSGMNSEGFNSYSMGSMGEIMNYHVVTEEFLTSATMEMAVMHHESGDWESPHIYIVRIKDRPDLFGIVMNKNELQFEENAYTVY